MRQYVWRLFYPLVLLTTASCQRVPPANDRNVSNLLEERTGHTVSWFQERECAKEIKETTAALVKDELTLEKAIAISLLNNRNLQAQFEDIGVSHAELVQAGLLQNPFFTALVRFPINKKASLNTELSLVQNFIDIFSLPMRKKYARIQLVKSELMVTDMIMTHVTKVENCYFHLQAVIAKANVLRDFMRLERAAVELAKAQYQAGTLYEASLIEEQKKLYEVRVQLVDTKKEVFQLREELNALMGITGELADWKISFSIPEIPQEKPQLQDVEKIALDNRLDIKTLMQDIEAFSVALGMETWWSRTKAQIGASFEREPEGISVLGPALALEIPIFDYGQAERARICALLKQKTETLAALTITIQAEIRAAKQTYLASYDLAHYYQETMLPLSLEAIGTAEKLYNSMSISSFELLNKKKEQLELQLKAVEASVHFWLSHVDLAKKIGGKLLLQS